MTSPGKASFADFLKNQLVRLNSRLLPLKIRYQNFSEKNPRLARGLLWGGGGLLVCLLAAFFFAIAVYRGAFGPLPAYAELRAIQNYTASQVYAEDSVLLGKYYIENRLNADFEEISPTVIQALIATEDARFFEHSGIDLRAWVRVFLRTVLLRDNSGGGGSTLSQQLAKNLFPRQDHGLFSIPANKIKEMFIARRLERLYTKAELLNLYLNTVSFSDNIYGIKVAAQRFFGTSPKDLKAEQAAVLVGMLKGTSLYDPVRHPQRALGRRNTVLAQMRKYEYISAETLDSLLHLPLNLSYLPEGNDRGLATYFREHLRLELESVLKKHPKPDGTFYNLYTDGLKIYTTIDSRLQKHAEAATTEQMKKLQASFDEHWRGKNAWGNEKTLDFAIKNSDRYKKLKAAGIAESVIDSIFKKPVAMSVFSWEKGAAERTMSPLDSIKYYLGILNVGFLAMDPASGKILAWVGGIDHHFFKYDHVKSKRQPGSTFKPIVYAAALQKGISPCHYLDNTLTTYANYEGWTPENSEGEYGGVYSMEGALCHSVNTATVQLMMETGVDTVRQMALNLGVESDLPKLPSIALGTAEISLKEMVKVYAAFANKGLSTEPYYLLRIETAEGKVLVDFEKNRKIQQVRALSAEQAAMMTKMLQTVVDSGTANRLRWEFGLWSPIAGKTGTTQNNSDGWFIGYTPKIVAGVWVGGELPQIRFRSMALGQGASTALPIWGSFYKKVLEDSVFMQWKKSGFALLPDSLTEKMDCPLYLPERPFFDGDDYGKEGWKSWMTAFLNVFKKDEEPVDSLQNIEGIPENSVPSGSRQPRSEASERIRKKNEQLEEKRERKEKRKEFWDKVFGREQ